MSSMLVRCLSPLVVVATGALLLPGCGGGGGGSKSTSIGNPIITLVGPTSGASARLSRLPVEANADAGSNPPPSVPSASNGKNHWFRLEFPVALDRRTILDSNPILSPFDYLLGTITISDVTGNHVPGLALVNGIDAKGVSHVTDTGFPHDVVDGVDKNVQPNVFLYVANVDGDLSTTAAFGWIPDPNNPNQRLEVTTSNLSTIRITVGEVNGFSFDAIWTIHIGDTVDTSPPYVVRADSEMKDPTQPTNDDSASSVSSFIVEFSKPMVPHSVGTSAILDADNGNPYDGNMPRPPLVPPLPPCAFVATVTSSIGNLFVPFDCEPLNDNNLAAYRLRPLVSLPPNASVDLVVRAVTNNTGTNLAKAPMDLSGNRYDGQDLNGDGVGDQADLHHTFSIGPGPGVVNIPVSPEVVYWLPGTGDGIGAIDLNGHGFTTNTPGANFGVRELAGIITLPPFVDAAGNLINPTGLNAFSGIALFGSSGNPQVSSYNGYLYPIGTGGFSYGAGVTKDWLGLPTDLGNSGTLVPGVNEMSSGVETLCRSSSGDAILTGSSFGTVGNIQDLIVGDFLDVAYFDSESTHTINSLHVTIFNSPKPHRNTGRGNTMADPPTPNPPPTRYWAGLPSIGIVLNQVNPLDSPLLIEGDEVFVGNKSHVGFAQLIPNKDNPASFDQFYFPHVFVGPSPQSATAAFTYSSRQQIGNFLYAADGTNGELQVLNSNTMRVIKSIPLPDPAGLAIAPDLKRVFVSNFADNTVSVINCDPLGASFHQEVARIQVGSGPRSIAVQPDNEDIFCCNYLGNTVSIISTTNLAVRKTLDQLISSPYDVELTERQPTPPTRMAFGWACGLYFGYISNFSGNTVVVFESGPDGPTGIGFDDILGSLPTENKTEEIIEPRGLCASPFPDPAGVVAGGCFVAHRDAAGNGRVSEIQFTTQAIYGPLPVVAPPGLRIPPGFLKRQFDVTGTWGNQDSNRLAGIHPIDVCLADENVAGYQASPSSAPNNGAFGSPVNPVKAGSLNSKNHMRNSAPVWQPDRLYVSFSDVDTIQVIDPANVGVTLKTIPGAGTSGAKKLMSFWRE